MQGLGLPIFQREKMKERKPKKDKKIHVIAFRISDQTYQALDKLSQQREKRLSAVARDIILEHVV
jgi:predicted DNA-binding protein